VSKTPNRRSIQIVCSRPQVEVYENEKIDILKLRDLLAGEVHRKRAMCSNEKHRRAMEVTAGYVR
jgi:hypothetical protein